MTSRLAAALVALLVMSAQASQYTLTYNPDTQKYTITQDTTVIANDVSATANTGLGTNEIALTTGGKVSLLATIAAKTATDVNNAITGAAYNSSYIDTVVQLSPSVYRGRDLLNYPYVVYWIDSTSGDVTCWPTTPIGTDPFACGVVAVFNYTAPSSLASSSSISIGIAVSNNNYYQELLAIAASRANELVGLKAKVAQEVTANAAALQNARTAVGFLYAFVAMAMVLITLVIANWQSWLCPIIKRTRLSFFMWFGILSLVVWLVTIFGGAVGWIVILVLFGVYGIVLPIIYSCFWCRRKRRQNEVVKGKPSNYSDNEQQEEESELECSTGEDDSPDEQDEEPEAGGGSDGGAPEASEGQTNDATADDRVDNKGFNRCPDSCGRTQKILFIVLSIMVFLWLLSVLIIFYAWKNQEYSLYNRGTGLVETEFQPSVVAKGVWVIYAFPRLADIWRVNPLLVANTKFCGSTYNKVLSTDDEKKKAIYTSYIEEYSIDMSIYGRQTYDQYTTVNDWFTRALAPGVRPIAFYQDDKVLISGADCRLTVFTKVPADQEVWLKDNPFTIEKLIGDATQAAKFTNGAMSILRLAPADYHRTHSPIAGTIVYQQVIESTIFSVGANPMKANDGAIYNTRVVTIIENPAIPSQKIAFVAIGATCVGSIVMQKGVGMNVTKGENFSYFQFGGSTVAIVYPPNAILWDSDLAYATSQSTEMLVRMGSKVGMWL